MDIRFNNIYLEALAKDDVKGKPKYSKDVVTKFKKTLKILEIMPTTNGLWNDIINIREILTITELTNHYQ